MFLWKPARPLEPTRLKTCFASPRASGPLVHSSFFQSVCVLGYCVFPLLVSAVCCLISSLFGLTNVIVRVAFVLVGFVWATRGISISHESTLRNR